MGKPYERGIDAADASAAIFISFCLVSSITIGALGTVDYRYLGVLAAILSITTVVALTLSVAPQLSWALAAGAQVLSGGTIIWTLNTLSESRYWYLSLIAVCWIAVPAALNMMTKWFYLAIAGIFLMAVEVIIFQQSGSAMWLRGAMLLVISVLSTVVVFFRHEAGDLRRRDVVKRRGFELHLLRHIWPACAMQTGLILLLVFSDIVFWTSGYSPTLAIRLYGLLFVILGSFVLSAVEPKRRGVFFLFHTIVLGVLVIVGSPIQLIASGYGETQLLLSVMTLGVLCATTLTVPWPLTYQVILSWAMVTLGGVLFLLIRLSSSEGGLAITDLFGSIGKAITVLIGTAATVVLIARSMRYYAIGTMPDEDKLRPAKMGTARDSGSQRIVPVSYQTVTNLSAREGIGKARMRRLWRVLLVLGALSTAISLYLTQGLSMMQIGFGGFYILWGLVIALLRKQAHEEHLWYLAALATLLLLLWSSSLIVISGTREEAWLLFPLMIIVGIGFIPWRLSELFPLVVAGTLVGVATAQTVGAALYGIAFLVSALLSLYLAVTTFRETKERYLLLEFQRSLRRCLNEQEASRLLADHLMTLFDTPEAVVISEHNVELIFDSQIYVLTRDSVPLEKLRELKKHSSSQNEDIKISVLDWIPSSIIESFTAQGLFIPHHGLLMELCFKYQDERGADPHAIEQPNSTLHTGMDFAIFLPLKSPGAQIVRGGEITLAHTLAGETLLVLGTFAERIARLRDYKRHMTSLMTRDYELSSLVHDINNTVQDLTLLCDTILDDHPQEIAGELSRDEQDRKSRDNMTMSNVKRIAAISRMIATVVSDVKRKRELDRQVNLAPREYVDIRAVAQEMTTFAEVRGERRRVGVSPKNIDGEAVWVYVSSYDHLETVVRNLVSSALSRSKPGTDIKLAIRESAPWVYFDIADTGPGFSKEEIRSLFEEGPVKDSAATLNETTLGLKQLRRFAEEQGGSLDVESAGAGQGATFTLMFPRREAPRDSVRRTKAWALIVDDEPMLTEGYARIARALHLDAVVAYSIEEATAYLSEQTPPAVVMTDLFLQDRSGIELVRSIREVYGSKVPVLVVSGTADEEAITQIKNAGATDFIVKPVGQRTLYVRLQTLLGRT